MQPIPYPKYLVRGEEGITVESEEEDKAARAEGYMTWIEQEQAKAGKKPDSNGASGNVERYVAKHSGGGHYKVIDTQSEAEPIGPLSKEDAAAKAAELNAGGASGNVE